MSDIWDNPLIPVKDRLDVAIGAVTFERRVSANQREQKEKLELKLKEASEFIQKLGPTIDYDIVAEIEEMLK